MMAEIDRGFTESQYWLLFKSNPLPMWVYDLETLGFIEVNSAAVERYGYSRDEFLSMTIKDIRPPEDVPALLENVSRVTDGLDRAGVWRHIKKDGSLIYVEIVSHVLLFNGRRAELVLANDVTERRRAEEALARSERKYRALVDNALVGVYSTNMEGRLLYANSSLARIFEFDSPEEMISVSVLDHYKDPADRERFIRELMEKGAHHNYEIEMVTKEKNPIRVITSGTMEGGVMSGMLVDITERAKLEEQLRHSHKMEAVGALTAGVAHEFHNILAAIMGSAEALKESTPPDSPLTAFIEVIEASVERAVRLTDSLKAYSRTKAMHFERVDLCETLAHFRDLLAHIVPPGVAFEFLCRAHGLAAMADRDHIVQALMNLAKNAIDAMPQGGTLAVHAEGAEVDETFVDRHACVRPGRYAVVSVRDTGEGIDDDALDKVFEPFFTTRDVGKGMGLGLSMAYGVLRRHDGYISASSSPGKGTAFKVYIPLAE